MRQEFTTKDRVQVGLIMFALIVAGRLFVEGVKWLRGKAGLEWPPSDAVLFVYVILGAAFISIPFVIAWRRNRRANPQPASSASVPNHSPQENQQT